MYSFSILLLLFFIYSIIGWIVEVINFLIIDKKFINRGFLIGPVCPIYGCGSIFMITTLTKYLNDPIALFVMCVIECGILEYFTSYIMEKIFKTRWWDYSQKKYNINGRVCLETLLLFGIGGLAIMYVVNPIIMSAINMIPKMVLIILTTVFTTTFIIDYIVSFAIIYNFKTTAKNIKKDSTEEVTKMVRKALEQKGYFQNRLVKAFPGFESKLKVNKEKIRKFKRK